MIRVLAILLLCVSFSVGFAAQKTKKKAHYHKPSKVSHSKAVSLAQKKRLRAIEDEAWSDSEKSHESIAILQSEIPPKVGTVRLKPSIRASVPLATPHEDSEQEETEKLLYSFLKDYMDASGSLLPRDRMRREYPGSWTKYAEALPWVLANVRPKDVITYKDGTIAITGLCDVMDSRSSTDFSADSPYRKDVEFRVEAKYGKIKDFFTY